jgi:hypothetical protein
MPEGPEVRRFADALNQALTGKPIVSLKARTKTASSWEKEHPDVWHKALRFSPHQPAVFRMWHHNPPTSSSY